MYNVISNDKMGTSGNNPMDFELCQDQDLVNCSERNCERETVLIGVTGVLLQCWMEPSVQHISFSL